jgi:hypothetical protein
MLVTRKHIDPRPLRLSHLIADVFADLPEHARGWTRWTDRMFYRDDNNRVQSFSELWHKGPPAPVAAVARAFRLTRHQTVRSAFRLAFARGEQAW